MDDAGGNDDGDDARRMRLAFEAFMLAGGQRSAAAGDNGAPRPASDGKSKKKRKKGRKSSSGGAGVAAAAPAGSPAPALGDGVPSPPPSATTSRRSMQANTSDRKRYYRLLRSFNDKVQRTWFDLDDQLLSVMQNIVDIRGRLPMEWKLLQSSHLKRGEGDERVPEGVEEEGEEDDDEEGDWKYCGPLGKPRELSCSFHLRADDVRLALAHDLGRHEEMLAGARSLASDLAECHDALGRALDALWKFHLECSWGGDEGEGDGMQHLVDCVTDAFQMLSMELYRKQMMVPLILESTHDGILGIEVDEGSNNKGDPGGLQVARKCCKAWRRSCKESCIDDKFMSHVLNLGETSQQNDDT